METEFQNNAIKKKDTKSILYFLAGQEDIYADAKQHRILQTIGFTSLITLITFGIIFVLYMYNCFIGNLPLSILLGILFGLFWGLVNRTFFLYAYGNTKTIAIILYLLLYLVFSYIVSYYFLIFYLDSEIANNIKNQTSLENSEALLKVISKLNNKQKEAVSNFRLLISFVLCSISLLPLINFLWYQKSISHQTDFEIENSNLKNNMQNQILKLKYEYSNSFVIPDKNKDDPFSISTDEKSLKEKQQELLEQILFLERSLQLL